MPLPRNIFNPTLYNRISDLWFAGISSKATVPPEAAFQRWFPKDKAVRDLFDSECRKYLEDSLVAIGPDKAPIDLLKRDLEDELLSYTDEKEQSQNALSLIILLDQIPRNLYRTPPNIKFVYNHYDALSLALIRRILSLHPRPDLHLDIRYRPVIRMWFLMPLMHSESLSDHQVALSILDEIKADMQERNDEAALGFVAYHRKFETQHSDLIEKFGRYPHRNDVLGRESTPDEKKHLEDGGERFGVSS